MLGSLAVSLCVSPTNPVVNRDPSTPPGSSSAPAEPPPEEDLQPSSAALPLQSSRGLAHVRSQPGLGGAESCGAWMDNYPATLRCNEWHGRGVTKPSGGMEKGVRPE